MKRIISTSILCLTVGLSLAACGGSSDDAAGSTATQAAGEQQAQGNGGPSQGGSGEVTDVSGSTAQVKGTDSQVAVTWTDTTTFTQQVAATAADLAVGSCVMVTSAAAADGSASTATDTVDAASVRITEAVDGSCSVMGGGGGGGAPQGGGAGGGEAPSGERPTDMPSGSPEGGQGGGQRGGGRGGFAVGEVTAVTDTGFTVSSQQPAADGAEAEATTVTVTTSADTTYTATAAAKASDVTVGVCVTSRGDADDTGAITATSIAVTQPVDGACSTGFGGGFGGGRPADAS